MLENQFYRSPQDMNYAGSTCICRVPKAQLKAGVVVECTHCGQSLAPLPGQYKVGAQSKPLADSKVPSFLPFALLQVAEDARLPTKGSPATFRLCLLFDPT